MNADVDVRQIKSDSPKSSAYFNVEHAPGYISVWGCDYDRITILAFVGQVTFQLFQFESQEYYDEWLAENRNSFYNITNIKDIQNRGVW
jgi:hypothetical protein